MGILHDTTTPAVLTANRAVNIQGNSTQTEAHRAMALLRYQVFKCSQHAFPLQRLTFILPCSVYFIFHYLYFWCYVN